VSCKGIHTSDFPQATHDGMQTVSDIGLYDPSPNKCFAVLAVSQLISWPSVMKIALQLSEERTGFTLSEPEVLQSSWMR